MRTLYFCPVVCSFFLASSQPSQIGCLPYFHTWCGVSANLECMSEMCCTWLAGNTGPQKSPSGHHRTILSDHIFATKVCIENRKKSCFRVLAALLHGTLVVGVSQTLRRWTEGATYIRQGGHHVGHWPTFFVWFCAVAVTCNEQNQWNNAPIHRHCR